MHGFTLAMTSQNKFYRPISELDNDGGYADIFLSPLCDIYKDMVDSYIIELKYCKSQTTDEQVKKLQNRLLLFILMQNGQQMFRSGFPSNLPQVPELLMLQFP